MLVTDKQYSIEKKLVKILDLISLRLTKINPKWDYPLLVDGYEGYGKTNIAAGCAYYVAQKTGREFGINQIFFDPEEMVDYAIRTDKQIIMWDEAALAALAMQGTTEILVAIIKMLMVARKKRHFFIINIPRFFRLKEAIIERCMGLIHVYARHETQIGRFTFYKKKGLDNLYEDWKKTRRKPPYNKYVSVRGTFGEALPLVVDESEYDKKKDIAILSIADRMRGKGRTKEKDEFNNLKKSLSLIKTWPITSQKDLAARLGINYDTLLKWKDLKTSKDDKRFSKIIREAEGISNEEPEMEEKPNAIQEEGLD